MNATAEVNVFLMRLKNRGWAGKTIRKAAIAVKKFFKVNDVLLSRVVKVRATPGVEDKAPRLVDIRRLFQHGGLREKVLLAVLFTSGRRFATLVGLKLEHVDLGGEGGVVNVPAALSKNGRGYTTFISPEAVALVKEYLDYRRVFSLAGVDEDVRFEKDSEWLSRHYIELQTRYPNKYVAVLNERIVGVGDDGERLYVDVVGEYGREPVIDFIKDTKTIQVGRLKANIGSNILPLEKINDFVAPRKLKGVYRVDAKVDGKKLLEIQADENVFIVDATAEILLRKHGIIVEKVKVFSEDPYWYVDRFRPVE